MPSWILPALTLAYGAILTLLILASAFSYDADRRDAAFRVLRIMLPWGIVALLIDMKLHEHDPAQYFAAIAADTTDEEPDSQAAESRTPDVSRPGRSRRPRSRTRTRP